MKPVWRYLLPVAAVVLAGAMPVLASEAPGGHGADPQLFTPPQEGLVVAITTLIVFAALLAVLGKFAWGPIASGLKAREDRIRQDISNAEAARARAEATLQQYKAQLATAEEQVRKMIADAIAQGERVATDIKMRAQGESEEVKQRATREINAAKDQALVEIYESAADISTSIAAKILQRNINAEDQRDLVQRSLDQLQGVGRP